MSVRAVAVRGIPRARPRVVSRVLGTAAHRPMTPRVPLGVMARLADDHQLVRVKALVLAVLLLLAMATEVPP